MIVGEIETGLLFVYAGSATEYLATGGTTDMAKLSTQAFEQMFALIKAAVNNGMFGDITHLQKFNLSEVLGTDNKLGYTLTMEGKNQDGVDREVIVFNVLPKRTPVLDHLTIAVPEGTWVVQIDDLFKGQLSALAIHGYWSDERKPTRHLDLVGQP